MVRSSAGREFHDAGPEKEKARSPKLVRSSAAEVWCRWLFQRERAQTGACHSGRRRLHNVGQITLRLSDVNFVNEGAELVGNCVTNW